MKNNKAVSDLKEGELFYVSSGGYYGWARFSASGKHNVSQVSTSLEKIQNEEDPAHNAEEAVREELQGERVLVL